MKMRLADLKIDEDFKNLLPELDAETYTALEKDIMANGMIDPIVIWKGYIADGHNRYSICKAHRVAEVETKELHKKTKSEVMQWIVDHQFGKRNLKKSEQVRLLLKVEEQIAKEAKERQAKAGGDRKSNEYKKSVSPNLDEAIKDVGRTDEIMAKKAGVSKNTYRDMKTVVQKGTEQQIARMDKGGRGNSASAIAKEIKEGIPDGYRKCYSCGEVKMIEYFKKGEQENTYKTICKECYNKQERERRSQNVNETKVSLMHNSDAPRANYYDVNAKVEWKFEDIEGEIDHLIEDTLRNLRMTYKVHSADVFSNASNLERFKSKITEFTERLNDFNKEF